MHHVLVQTSIHWLARKKKLMNRIDYSSSVENSPKNFTCILSKLCKYTIQHPNSKIYQPQDTVKHHKEEPRI